jgi:putative flippase GtrA
MVYDKIMYNVIRSFLGLARRASSATPVKYAIVGVAGQTMDFLLTIWLINAWFPVVAANTIGYISASLFSYVGHARFTFSGQSSKLESPRQLIFFACACLVGAGLGSILLAALLHLNIPTKEAKLFQLATIAVSQYLINRFLTFRRHSDRV